MTDLRTNLSLAISLRIGETVAEELSKDQWAHVDAICADWFKATSGPMSPKFEESVNTLYRICDLKAPKIIVCKSPVDAAERAVADGTVNDIASAVPYVLYWRWWWAAYCQIAVEVLGIPGLEEAFAISMALRDIHCILPYDTLAYLPEKPAAIHCQGDQLHKVGSKCVEYKDGWGWYALHDIAVEEWMACSDPSDWTVQQVLDVQNVDQRREVIARFGIDRLWCKAKVLDKQGDYELGELDVTGSRRVCLKMVNPSIGCFHVEPVGPDCKTIEQAHLYRESRTKASDEGADYYQQGDIIFWPLDENGKEHKVYKKRPKSLT